MYKMLYHVISHINVPIYLMLLNHGLAETSNHDGRVTKPGQAMES